MILSSRPWGLFVIGILLVVVASAASVWFVTSEQQRLHNADLMRQLLSEARLVREIVRTSWPRLDAAAVGLIRTLQEEGVLVAVTDGDGIIVNGGVPAIVGDLSQHREVRAALDEGVGAEIRPLGPKNRQHVVVAVRVGAQPRQGGVVWLARPVWAITEHPAALGRLMGIASGLIGLATLLFILLFLRLRQRVLQRVIETARSLSTGNLSSELDVAGADELAVLSSTLNALRRRMASQVETIDRQRRMLQSLVDHLGEGVLVADSMGRIALANPAATKLLDLGHAPGARAGVIGRPVESCIRQHALQRLLLGADPIEVARDQAPAIQEPSREGSDGIYLEVEMPSRTVHLLARTSAIDLAEVEGTDQKALGRVVVLTDVTELERTFEMRSDFVANASHELRTPLSTIRIAVETLLAMDLATEGRAAQQFLTKIDRHSARLQQMVADLLDLSRLESPAERFTPENIELKRLLHELHFRFAELLERKEIEWRVRIQPPELRAVQGNAHLLRLVLDNLVDNAVKFTEPNGCVGVEVRRADGWAEFEVSDTGCGIPEADQARVFERFYQVQRSRSGAERGTGLGLSIVRHAIGAMQGEVRLRSTPGEGTRVTVRVPQGPNTESV